ncbi:hypothetical protein AURDEDRAFT_167169 [Auricularia subglabra TFB-10046 SS5]|nr:hypothetical protein AURDEDRAFT_167169 [Auricularia subglabra TFB-10046 SS5]
MAVPLLNPRRSPYTKTERTLRENCRATIKYEMENKCHRAGTDAAIVPDARSAVGAELWARLIGDATVGSLAVALGKMGYSDGDLFAHTVTTLLNTISRLYVSVVIGCDRPDTPAIVFSAHDNRYIPGDYLGVNIKPDTTAFMGTLSTLLEALAKSTPKGPYINLEELTNLLLVGEWKPRNHERFGQVLWYLSSLNRCRPDLNTVYGFLVENKQVQLISHNACGTGYSKFVPLATVDVWVALVVHGYACDAARDQRFESVTDTSDRIARWRISTVGDTPSTFRPFHANPSPGRVTWLSFEEDEASPDLACGFLKVSWQDASAQFNEPDLLDLAHKDAWLPGLVRPRWTCRDMSETVKSASPSGAPERVKEIIHLASIGQPLSQARSLAHLLKIIADAIKVHELLLELDIIHRDLSWFNLLCNPRHDPSTLKDKAVRQGIPFIDYILTGKDSEPNCLVVDLDHGALMKQLYADTYDPRKHKSGTPMFVSVELSSEQGEMVGTVTRDLYVRLQALDKREYSDLLARAFPNGDQGFMAAFRKVQERELNRFNVMHDDYCDARTDPEELHRARHDMESLFWVTFWALFRASPISTIPDDSPRKTVASAGNAMLDHTLAEDEQPRNGQILLNGKVPSLLHSALRDRAGPLLRDMATYVSIPWHLHTASIPGLPPNHAHIAFTRMLVVEIYEIVQAGDILFDRTVPRNIRHVKNSNQDNSSKPKRPLGTGSNPATRLSQDVLRRTAGRATSGAPEDGQARTTREAASQRGTKHGTDTRDVDDGAGAPDDGQARTTSEAATQRGTKRGTGTRDVDDGASEPPPAPKRAKRAPGSAEAGETRDISTLVDMFFNDRVLWFGVGDREKTKAAANAEGDVTAQAGPTAEAGETSVVGAETNDAAHDNATTKDAAHDNATTNDEAHDDAATGGPVGEPDAGARDA